MARLLISGIVQALTDLRAKLEELRDSAQNIEAPSNQAVRDAEEALRDAMLNGTPGQRKALIKELVVEVRSSAATASFRPSVCPRRRFALRKAWWAVVSVTRTKSQSRESRSR
jgi:hypothetical protein